MPDQPYTTADLHAEAARQHATLAADPDFMGIGEQMEGAAIPSTVVSLEPETGEAVEFSQTWDQLSEAAFETAQKAIDDLLTKAADLSEWAVRLGTDGLEPDAHLITVGAGERPIARIHFAFSPDMEDETRTALAEGVSQAIANAL
jgi:hypothetical protein